MTETNQERSLGYTERLISTRDYEPEVHLSQVTVMDERGIERHRNIPELHLRGDSEIIKLSGRPMRKLVSNYMGFGYRNLVALVNDSGTNRSALNEMIWDRYDDMTADKLCLQEHSGKVTRLTTDAYEGIDHAQVQGVIENRLTQEGITFENRTRFEGGFQQYLLANHKLEELGGDVIASVGFLNKNDGESSLKLFGGGDVQVCSNGMVFGDLTKRLRLIHKQSFVEVERKIERGIGGIISGLEIVPKQLLSLKEISVSQAEARDTISYLDIPIYLHDAVQRRLWDRSNATENGKMDWDETLYGVYMAMTYIGSNATRVQRSKNISVDITSSNVSKLQNINTLRDAWDLREKDLENMDAIKVEQ